MSRADSPRVHFSGEVSNSFTVMEESGDTPSADALAHATGDAFEALVLLGPTEEGAMQPVLLTLHILFNARKEEAVTHLQLIDGKCATIAIATTKRAGNRNAALNLVRHIQKLDLLNHSGLLNLVAILQLGHIQLELAAESGRHRVALLNFLAQQFGGNRYEVDFTDLHAANGLQQFGRAATVRALLRRFDRFNGGLQIFRSN